MQPARRLLALCRLRLRHGLPATDSRAGSVRYAARKGPWGRVDQPVRCHRRGGDRGGDTTRAVTEVTARLEPPKNSSAPANERDSVSDNRRLIEVAFPLEQASIDSVHEKTVRHGH